MVERFGGTMPRFFQSNVEIENSARLLGRTGQLQTLGLQDTALPEADYGLEGKSSNPFRLSARPFDPPALNPDPNGWIFALMYLLVFYLVLFRLLERTAAILAGLYLEVTEPLPGAVEALNQLIAEPLGPQRAWDALESREERLLLLSLAQGRTLNFRERGTIQALVQKGYLRLTPYLHITHEKLTNYLKHDLPQGQRADALQLDWAAHSSLTPRRVWCSSSCLASLRSPLSFRWPVIPSPKYIKCGGPNWAPARDCICGQIFCRNPRAASQT
jgi:hypothetical protein